MATIAELEKQLDTLALEQLRLELQLKDVEEKMAFIRLQLTAKYEEVRKAYSDALYAESKKVSRKPRRLWLETAVESDDRDFDRDHADWRLNAVPFTVAYFTTVED